MSVEAQTHPASDYRAAVYSAILPGLGHLLRGRHKAAMFFGFITILLIILSLGQGRVGGNGVDARGAPQGISLSLF